MSNSFSDIAGDAARRLFLGTILRCVLFAEWWRAYRSFRFSEMGTFDMGPTKLISHRLWQNLVLAPNPIEKIIRGCTENRNIASGFAKVKMAPPNGRKAAGKFAKPKNDARSLKRKRVVDDHERLEKEIKELVHPHHSHWKAGIVLIAIYRIPKSQTLRTSNTFPYRSLPPKASTLRISKP